MATPGRGAGPPLEDILFREPFRFDFFQAVRLLRRLGEGRASVGEDGPPPRESVRFRARTGLHFPASAVERLDRADDDGAPPAMTVNFFGLTGPSGVMPHVYTELIQARARASDAGPAAFLDLLNHRLISLFYGAWEKHHIAVAAEAGGPDRFAGYLFSLIGLGLKPLTTRHAFPDRVLLTYAGFLARRQRPAIVLEAMLADHFGIDVEVVPFAGQWLVLGEGDRSIVGSRPRNNALGVDFVLGARVYDEQGKVRLRLGPLGFSDFLAYLPDGPSFRPLVEMARLFLDAEFDLDVQLVLKAEEAPACRLSSRPGEGARLGRYAWLGGASSGRDLDDAVFAAGL